MLNGCDMACVVILSLTTVHQRVADATHAPRDGGDVQG